MKNKETRRKKIEQLRESKLSNITIEELDSLKKQIESNDSFRETRKLLKKYIPLKVAYSERLVADDTNDSINFEDLSIELMEDLNICYRLIKLIIPSDYDTQN